MKAALPLWWTSVFVMSWMSAMSASANVQLLPHQQLPIDYMIKNPDIKGLLINHYMGTGKTYLAIGLAEAFPERPVVILAPRFIEAHWKNQLKAFGVVNFSRYEFVAYHDAAEKLKGRDLSNTIVIADEVHNLIRYLKSTDPEKSSSFSNLYLQLRQSYKILGLSGTPIYNDEYDMAYLLNLISGQDLFPFNEEDFRLKYTSVKPWSSFWRGYMSESMMLGAAFSTFCGMALGIVFLSLWAFGAGNLIGLAVFPLVNDILFPLEKFQLRYLDVPKFRDVTSKYVSFYEVQNDSKSDFPTQNLKVVDVEYNIEQFRYFLNFAEVNLSTPEFMRLLKEESPNLSKDYVDLNSTSLQARMRNTTGSGREIGNMGFVDDKGVFAEAPKFVEILKLMGKENPPQTVIYSNYFENGVMAFAAFLEKEGLGGQFAILKPDLDPAEQAKIVNDYNEGKTKILILHPEITEGISLKGTRQLHLLEPVMNTTVFNQIVGRTVRYQSHKHLPEVQRHVDIYLWKATIGKLSLANLAIKKENWLKRRRELNDWSYWGRGMVQIDKHHRFKLYSPDEYASMRLANMNENIDALKEVFKNSSIETSIAEGRAP
jgi:hypothetical protein